MAVSIINSRWIASNDYTVANGVLRSDSTIDYRSLGDGKFYFEIINGSGSSNRWIGLTDKDNPPWNAPASMLGTMIAIWQPVANAVYGVHLDLTSATQGKLRWNVNGGNFSNWADIKDHPQNIITKIKPVIGSAASANPNVSTFINAGQAPFLNSADKLLEDSEFEGTHFFDGSGSFATSKTLLSAKGKYYSVSNIDTWYETNMTSDTSPSPLMASASRIYNTSYPAWKAFDNDLTTSWLSLGSANEWLTIDLGEKKLIDSISIQGVSSAITTSYVITANPKNMRLQGSNDNAIWNDLHVTTNLSWTKEEIKIFSFSLRKYQYIRIFIETNNGAPYIGISEVRVGYSGNGMVAYEIPSLSKQNFINYGKSLFSDMNQPIATKNYILQDTVSENAEGLWTTKINRKPLSIKFN